MVSAASWPGCGGWPRVPRRLGCRLLASGTASYRMPGPAAMTDQPSYRELVGRHGPLLPESDTCGSHLHVGVPSRDLGVQVLARLRPWTVSLLAPIEVFSCAQQDGR